MRDGENVIGQRERELHHDEAAHRRAEGSGAGPLRTHHLVVDEAVEEHDQHARLRDYCGLVSGFAAGEGTGIAGGIIKEAAGAGTTGGTSSGTDAVSGALTGFASVLRAFGAPLVQGVRNWSRSAVGGQLLVLNLQHDRLGAALPFAGAQAVEERRAGRAAHADVEGDGDQDFPLVFGHRDLDGGQDRQRVRGEVTEEKRVGMGLVVTCPSLTPLVWP
nr:hypothetical protein [Methylobacterium sp. WCS2018Hpa-22]